MLPPRWAHHESGASVKDFADAVDAAFVTHIRRAKALFDEVVAIANSHDLSITPAWTALFG